MRGLVQNLVMISCIFLMLTVGLRTSLGQLIGVTRQLRLLSRGLLANFLVLPTLLFLGMEASAVSPEVGIGIMIMAGAPAAPMAPAFVRMGRGDLPMRPGSWR